MYGTTTELAERNNIKEQTVRFYASPAHKKRRNQRDNALIVIEVEDDEMGELCTELEIKRK